MRGPTDRWLPSVCSGDIADMQQCPMRSFDPEILKEPNVYRTYEAITHYGEASDAAVTGSLCVGMCSLLCGYL